MYMIKILHSGDWHLDSPMLGHSEQQSRFLRNALAQVPGKMAAVRRQYGCDLVLLAGDLLDGACSAQTYQDLYCALQDMEVPVFITPGNHDFGASDSIWNTRDWPENVYIFKGETVQSVALPELDLRLYGAGFESMDCPGLLRDFKAQQQEKYAVGVFHGDPTQVNSSYNPITTAQVEGTGFDYLALGHIHKGGSFQAGKTLCAWPGCPMGRGYDEPGEKGVLVVTLEDTAKATFVPLDTPRFYNLQVPAEDDAQAALNEILPPMGSEDFYRITLTGPSEPVNIQELTQVFSRFPNLKLRDKTTPPLDIWGSAGEDSFEGIFFSLLQQQLKVSDEAQQEKIRLAAKISRQILNGQEVELP